MVFKVNTKKRKKYFFKMVLVCKEVISKKEIKMVSKYFKCLELLIIREIKIIKIRKCKIFLLEWRRKR